MKNLEKRSGIGFGKGLAIALLFLTPLVSSAQDFQTDKRQVYDLLKRRYGVETLEGYIQKNAVDTAVTERSGWYNFYDELDGREYRSFSITGSYSCLDSSGREIKYHMEKVCGKLPIIHLDLYFMYRGNELICISDANNNGILDNGDDIIPEEEGRKLLRKKD